MDAYSELLKKMTDAEIEAEVGRKIQSFHGFLTREVALRLIAKEKGLLKEEEKAYAIAEIPKGGKKISLLARVEKIFPEVVYPSGKRSRSILLKDRTGEINLKLWEDDIRSYSKIMVGSEVSVRNTYERYGNLNLGYRGTIETISKIPFTPLDSLPMEGFIHVFALVSKVEGISREGFAFTISDSENEVPVLIREGTDRGKTISEGDVVILENAKVVGGKLMLDSGSRLLLKRQKGLVSGKIEKIEERSGELAVEVGGKQLLFNRENSMKFLGAKLPEDVGLGTLVELKKELMLNSNMSVRVKEENGKFIILE